jgi:vesicular inhibitory amino acid transporter
MAVVGLLMFGDKVLDEVTSNILFETGYPRFIKIVLLASIGIIPITKLPLK